MNKLIYIIWINNYGGLERITQEYEKIFKYLNPLIAPLRFKSDGLKYNNYYMFRNKHRLSFIYEYISFAKKRNESIFHIQYAGSFILFLTYIAGARKIIYHFHGTKFSANFFDRIIWKLIGGKVKVIANSEYTKKVIKNRLNLSKNINIIPNLISTSNFVYNKRDINNKKFIVTYAGRFTKGKNLALLLDAVKQIEFLKKGNEFEFKLYGEGPDKINIVNKLTQLKLNNIVKVFPFENEINKVYQESHLFVFLSLYESFGNVAAEAILTGLPLICYRIPSLEEFINDDKFFIDDLNPELLADKIIDFKENYSEVTKRMESIYEFTSNYLDNGRIVNQLNEIYGI